MYTFGPNLRLAIESVIKAQNFATPPAVEVTGGSQGGGGGFTSRAYAITITGDGKALNLFIKCFPENNKNQLVDMFRFMFRNELRFYEEVYPNILAFQQEKDLQDIFDNLPKYYRTEFKSHFPAVILENLTSLGYSVRNSSQPIDDAHLILGLRAYAKLHATYFAMKDQKPDLFAQLCRGTDDYFVHYFDTVNIGESFGGCIEGFVQSLDPVRNNNVYGKCINLRESLIDFGRHVHKYVDEYSVVCHGDCWTNNIMYSYHPKTNVPTDIKLLDFQTHRYHSPTLDTAYFFYAGAGKEALENFDHYMELYYSSLAKHITNLGSDPDKMYPKEIFLRHWKQFSRYGLMMSFGVVRLGLLCKNEMFDMVDNLESKLPVFSLRFKNEDVYNERMMNLIKHFVENEFL